MATERQGLGSVRVIHQTQMVSPRDQLHFNHPVFSFHVKGHEKTMDAFSIRMPRPHLGQEALFPLKPDGKWNIEGFSEYARNIKDAAFAFEDGELQKTEVPLLPTVNMGRISRLELVLPDHLSPYDNLDIHTLAYEYVKE